MDTGQWAVQVPAGYPVGRWRISRPLGAGGWGAVYEGVPIGDGPTVAIKLVPTRILTARRLRHLEEMAEREIAAAAALGHPRLIRLFDTLVLADPDRPGVDGALALVMELAQASLAEPLPVAERAAAVVAICEGLAYVHGQGWTHGDLKPSNVLVMPDRTIRLADLGLAVELDGTHAYLPPMGSWDHLPPERLSSPISEHGTQVRASDDIWALGVTVHQILCGRMPFPGDGARARAAAAGRGRLELALDVPEPWRTFVTDCLALDPRARPGAPELLDRARAAQSGTASAWRAAAAAPGALRSRRRWVIGLAAATIAVGAAAGFVGLRTEAAPPGPSWFAATTTVPREYVDPVVAAGTRCHAQGVSPAVVAAILDAESGFDADLADPTANEYGIARWTPGVLQGYLPAEQTATPPRPPFPADVSIAALGRYVCWKAGPLADVPGDPGLKLGVAFQSSVDTVREQGLRPRRIAAYVDRLVAALARHRPTVTVGAADRRTCPTSMVCAVRESGPPVPVGADGLPPGEFLGSLVNNGGRCVALHSGPGRTGERVELPPRSATGDLGGTAFWQGVGSTGPCR